MVKYNPWADLRAREELTCAVTRLPDGWGDAWYDPVTHGIVIDDRLSRVERRCVLAHELAHVANRDATVMTVVGTPGAALREGAGTLCQFAFAPLQIAAALAGAIGLAAGAALDGRLDLGALLGRGRDR